MENLAREQHDRMLRGEPSGGDRRDSGRGHSSSDLGESLSSGSGSMSDRMGRLHLEKSVSIEDEVFQGTISSICLFIIKILIRLNIGYTLTDMICFFKFGCFYVNSFKFF